MSQYLVHAHVLYIINVQFRQTARDIINQDIASAYNTKFIRSKTFLVIVHNI